MLEDLDVLIDFMNEKYKEINSRWNNINNINFKKNSVKRIYINQNILHEIF